MGSSGRHRRQTGLRPVTAITRSDGSRFVQLRLRRPNGRVLSARLPEGEALGLAVGIATALGLLAGRPSETEADAEEGVGKQ